MVMLAVGCIVCLFFFFFKQKTAYEMRISDWSSDVCSSDLQVEAMPMADRIVVMNGGRVEQIGTQLELYDRPRNLFVATFIGSPAMNLLEGEKIGRASGRERVGQDV